MNKQMVLLASTLIGTLGCGDEGPPFSKNNETKTVDEFAIGEVSNGKDDSVSSLLNEAQLQRLEDSLLNVISQLDEQVVALEEEIRVTEEENARKYQEIQRIERDIRSREDELRRQANNNLFLCAFTYNPSLCSVAVLIDNDQRMNEYKYNLEKAKAERSLVERKIANYTSQKNSLSEQIEFIRQTKDRLINTYRSPSAGTTYDGHHPTLNTTRYKIDVLKSVRALTQEEILKLHAIKTLAQDLGESIDQTLLMVGQLASNVDQIIEDSNKLFMDLLMDIIFPGQGPSTIEKLMDEQIKTAVNVLIEDYDWPLAELVRHAMGLTGESSDELYKNVLNYYSALRFEYTKHSGMPILDHQTTTSSLEVEESLKPTELAVRLSITHDARGDLIVVLRHEESGYFYALHTREGGTLNDIRKVYNLDATHIEDTAGTWTLSIEDTMADDEGTLLHWSLSAFQN